MSMTVKKKHVRFAKMMDDDEQEEDTLFDQRDDAGKAGLKSALKGVKRTTKPGCNDRVKVIDGVRGGGYAACGRWMVSLALCASFLGLGMSVSVIGPTFEDLALNVKKNISNISYIFVGRSSGYIVGSLLGGILFDYMNPNLLLGISMLVTACGMCAIPFCKHALLLTVFMSGIGISMGILDTGGLVVILNMWGEQAQPHIQAQQFSFAMGSFVSPIIVQLLFGLNMSNNWTTGTIPTDTTSPFTSLETPNNLNNDTSPHCRSSNLKFILTYIMIGLFHVVSSLPFFFLSSCSKGSQSKSHESAKPLVARHHTALIVLLFFFCFASAGAEITFGSFIFLFAKKYAQLDQSYATGLNSLFWAMFAICQGISIFLVSCVSPGTTILISLVGTTLSSLFLCFFSKDMVALWVCTGLYGASTSSVFASTISWLEQYTTVTGRSAATFMVGSALGEMVQPALVGFLFGKVHGHPMLMYMSFITATFKSILFPVMYKLVSEPTGQTRKHHRRDRRDDSKYLQPLLNLGAVDDEDDENEADWWMNVDIEITEMVDTASLIKSSLD